MELVTFSGDEDIQKGQFILSLELKGEGVI